MRKFTFKPFKGDKTSSADDSAEPRNPTQKRREQVRRAQKTHRERKEAYVASLESEVVRLRANEARLESETKALYAENNALKRFLTQQGIPIPAETVPGRPNNIAYSSSISPDHTSTSFSDGATDDTFTLSIAQEDLSSKRKNRRKQIYIQQQPHAPPRLNPSSTAINFSQPISPPSSGSLPSHLASPNNPSPTPTSNLSALDPEALGMDFVLSLESPCLSHIDVGPPSSPPHSHSHSHPATPGTALTASTGHALTLSATLLHTHPSAAGQRLHSSTAWPVPRASLSQLLQLSAQIPLTDDEVTPIQAWEFVRKHEGFGGLDLARWEVLKEKLVGAVRCYGFGGVVDRGVLENSVFEAFVVGRVF